MNLQLSIEERCRMVEKCLPESNFRDYVTELHNEMLAEIARLHRACAECG